MRILKSLCISFSLYSKIPVPQFAWEEDDMKYVLCFFPWIGVVTGALLLLWSYICKWLSIGNLAFTLAHLTHSHKLFSGYFLRPRSKTHDCIFNLLSPVKEPDQIQDKD